MSENTLDRLVNSSLGLAPKAEPVTQQTEAAVVPDAVPSKEDNKADTPATTKTEGDAIEQPAVAYDLDWNGQKRRLTPEQIRGTFERYSALNEKHAALKPVISMAEELMQKTGAKPEDIMSFMAEAIKMQGAKEDPKAAAKAAKVPEDDELSRWEQENAASLPPGYREQAQLMRDLGGQMGSIKEMLAKVLGTADAGTSVAKMVAQDAQVQVIQARQQRMANNLNFVQQKLGLPDEAANDFLTFAAERGYTLEDFVDQGLTLRVATDFQNAMNSPEMERLKQIAAKRQAYTGGGVGAAPAGPAGAPAVAPEKQTLDRLTNSVLQRRA